MKTKCDNFCILVAALIINNSVLSMDMSEPIDQPAFKRDSPSYFEPTQEGFFGVQHIFKIINISWKEISDPTKLELNQFDFGNSVMRHKLKFPVGSELIFEKGVVKKMELITLGKTTVTRGPQRLCNFSNLDAILVLTLADKQKIHYFLPMPKSKMRTELEHLKIVRADTLFRTREIFIANGCHFDQALLEQDARHVHDWGTAVFTDYYNANALLYYTSAHEVIAEHLKDTFDLCHPENISIAAFGCGSGNELIVSKKKLKDSPSTIKFFGFDCNEKNLELGRNQDKEISFIKGDVLDLKKMLCHMACENPTRSFSVGIFSGILTNTCLPGTYAALKTLQPARKSLDLIIICGLEDSLLRKPIMRAAGFEVKERQTGYTMANFKCPAEFKHNMVVHNHGAMPKKFYVLNPMPSEDRIEYLKKRGTKRSSNKIFDCLDLSFSANPNEDIGLFSDASLELIKQIDISWSNLEEHEIESFFARLVDLNKPNLNILLSGCENSFKFIEKHLKDKKYPNMTVYKRLDARSNEYPAFAPIEAKSIGIYKSLPLAVIYSSAKNK